MNLRRTRLWAVLIGLSWRKRRKLQTCTSEQNIVTRVSCATSRRLYILSRQEPVLHKRALEQLVIQMDGFFFMPRKSSSPLQAFVLNAMDRWMHAVDLLLFVWTPHDTFLDFNVKPVELNSISSPHALEAHRDWTLLRTVLLTWTCNGFDILVQREEDRCYRFWTFIDVVLIFCPSLIM